MTRGPGDPSSQNFLDRGTIIALVLVMGFWFAWSKYIERAYPPPKPQDQSTAAAASPSLPAEAGANGAGGGPVKDGSPSPATPPANAAGPTSAAVPKTETLIGVAFENWELEISSRGMGFRSILLKNYTTRDRKPILLAGAEDVPSFATIDRLTGQPVDFVIERQDGNRFVGRGALGTAEVIKTVVFKPETYSADVSVQIRSAEPSLASVSTLISDLQQESSGGSILVPTYDFQDWYVAHEGTKTQTILHREKPLEKTQKNVSLAALSFHYFSSVVLVRSDLAPSFRSVVPANSKFVTGRMDYERVTPSSDFQIDYTLFSGPKSVDQLRAVDPAMAPVVNFGIFSFLARPMLWLLKVLESGVGNWGWAIVILTLLVRIVVLPFNLYSYRSMKALAKIQPEMQAIKERHKKDAQRANQEVMALMKAEKVNPLGGCLPILLQLPIFFALNAVLGQSIELYMAPFGLWIKDLSAHDPYFVLPALMAVAMYFQQKVTPTSPTMDPMQQKIMQWLPVVFSVLMIFLPSGLTLYIVVSTVFGIAQTYYFMRDPSGLAAQPSVGAKA